LVAQPQSAQDGDPGHRPAQSAYEEFGKRYQKALAVDGIDVVLLPSEGSSHNLQLLRDGQADAAFVQGGTAELQPDDPDNLVSLGSLFVEPLWLFYRTDAAERMHNAPRLDSLRQLRGWRVNVGSEGSGVPTLIERLLQANKVEPGSVKLSSWSRRLPRWSSSRAGSMPWYLPRRPNR